MEFIENHPEISSAQNSFNQAIEVAETNLDWIAKNSEEFAQFFNSTK